MRKLLAFLLISLLSLQASWAVAASYCRHEQGAAARHFGHHEHQHQPQLTKTAAQGKATPVVADVPAGVGSGAVGEAADKVADNAADKVADSLPDNLVAGLAGADLDCSVCHAHALPGVPSAPALSASDAPALSGAALVQHPLQTVPQPRPERPNWLAA